MLVKISRRELFEFLMEKSSETWPIRYKHVSGCIRAVHGKNISDDEWKIVKENIHNHCGTIKKRWEECKRHKEKFLKKYDVWLTQIVTLIAPSISPGNMQSINVYIILCIVVS